LKEGAARHSVHKELVVLRGALTSAKDRGLYHGSMDIVPKFRAAYEPRRTYLTPEQFMRLTECLVPALPPKARPETIAASEQRRARRALYCLLIAFASPRSGEVERLCWENIDFHRGIINIPKGKTRSRPVKMHPVLRPWLEAFDVGSGPVVEPWANVRRDLPAACRRAGVPRCTPNDLRRSFGSWLAQAGESLFVIARLMGHSSTRMVELVYGQLDAATLDRAIAKLPGRNYAKRRGRL
jgi:integrase